MSNEPAQIGRYRIEGAIGRGAMGVIYRAHDPDIDRPVAIKLIRADLLDGEERAGFIARFRREAQAAGRCAHPNIVAVYDFALHEGNPFLAMELVDGVTLAQARGQQARASPEAAVAIILQVLAALGAAHAMGVVHRDIKPANIMLTASNQVKVADFGISRMDASSLTTDGTVAGTPSYMSPEQCRGDTVDARSDLFSTGVVLYELLAGAKPFRGRNAAELFAQLLHQEAPDIGLARPGLSPGLRAVVARSLAKAGSDRFASAGEMAAALKGAAAGGRTADPDRTVVMPGRAPELGTVSDLGVTSGTGAFEPELIDTIERKLTQYVGPIARHLVRSAARTSDSMETLCASLAASIEQPSSRALFESDVRRHTGCGVGLGGTARQPGVAIEPAELERLQTALARHVGPVARVLVKRALGGASSAAALWRDLAAHVEGAENRAAFLKQAP